MDFFTFAIALISIIGGFITLWIFILYQRREKKVKQSAETQYDIRELSAMAQSMSNRIDTLEAILDAEVPDWREQHERAD
ncbi:MAG: envelope stress response membrane protein PspB [Gammaproteobacteria bacterium]|nr:envelope stress response membrane protein PspB [Pseudomonadales bacterium]MCP5330116.1 envelope stress response membrane protein PspB [Pseudomonadales bacterium]